MPRQQGAPGCSAPLIALEGKTAAEELFKNTVKAGKPLLCPPRRQRHNCPLASQLSACAPASSRNALFTV